jgi:uncharacterized membrane protein
MRFASVISVLSLVACVSPAEQARRQAVASAQREAWWPIQFADENQCIIQGYQEGTDAFDQCVMMKIDQQRHTAPRRWSGVVSIE